MSSLTIFFFLCLSMYACIARRLGFVAEEIGNHGYFLANKDVHEMKSHDQLQMRPSISKKLQTQELQEVGVHGRRMQENLISANIMKQTLLNSFLEEKEAVAEAISGYENIMSSRVDLQGVEKLEGLKRVTRSMLENSAGDNEEAVDSKENDNLGDIDVMDYSQPHSKPPIHNERD